jgi:hypothetical protein
MSGDPTCFGSLQVCALRVAVLASNGIPEPGADNGYVSDALITVGLGIELSTGDDLEKKNGCGAVCQTYKGPDVIKRATLSMALCELDVQLGQMLVGGALFLDGDDVPVGWEFPHITDAAPNGVCLELWTKAWDSGSQATPTALGNEAAYWHWVFPKFTGQLDNMTMEANFLDFAIKGNGEENPNMSHRGPFQDWPDAVADAGGITAVGGLFLDADLPSADCAFIVVPAQAS